MFLKILKWIGISLGALILVALIFYGYVNYTLSNKIDKTYSIEAPKIELKKDSSTLALGKHLALIKGCVECHGENMAGKIIMDDPAIGLFSSANLTRGKGGIPNDYSTEDWVKAIVYGVGRDNKSLLGMPCREFSKLSKKDLAALVAYCQNLPSVDNKLPSIKLGPVLKVIDFTGKIKIVAAEDVDPNINLTDSVPVKVNAEFGKYLSAMCSGCHKADFHGGPPDLPGAAPSPNLTSSGITGKVSLEQFMKTLRTGVNHEGRQLKNDDMPWKLTAHYSDDEIQSLYLYFKSLN